MKNSLIRSYQDDDGVWWFLQSGGTRQRAAVKTCKTCGEQFLDYPSAKSSYCSSECYRKPCKKCGAEFKPKTNRQVYCSDACKQKKAICKECGVEFVITKGSNGDFCSPSCFYDSLCPVGTVRDAGSGYKIIKVPRGTEGTKLTGSGRGLWMLEHRYVMQQMLGRPLEKHENVHHKNGNRADNRPENLELWKRAQAIGVRAADYHCQGCRCGHETKEFREYDYL